LKALIFGINGQDGYYLQQLLAGMGITVKGVSRSNGHWIQGDLKDFVFVDELIKIERPDLIFHLAANSTTRHHALFENHETISTGTLNILESVYRNQGDCKVFLSGSAMQFENKGIPINEYTPFEASSPYSVSRIQSVYAARYFRKLGIKVYVGYFFNHESPMRTSRHISRYIADAAKKIARGEQTRIELGDLKVKKEWNYAGDFARAIYTLVSQETIYEAIIGSGVANSIEEWLNECFGLIDRDWKDYVDIKKDFVPEYRLLVSDPRLIYSLGYRPEIDFKALARLMMLDNG